MRSHAGFVLGCVGCQAAHAFVLMPELFPSPADSFLGFWVISAVGVFLALANSGTADDGKNK